MMSAILQRLPMWVARHPRRAGASAAALLVGGLVTWAMGGFRDAPPAAPPVYAAEATITTNEWHLRPLRAWIADRDPIGRRATAGAAILIVELHAENRTNRSSGSVMQALRLLSGNEDPSVDPVRQGATPVLILLRDPSYGGIVHPGLPERLAAVWDLRPPAVPPTQARIRIIGREWIERDSLIAGSGWLRDRPVGELTLSVEDRRTPSPAPSAAASGGRP